LGALARRDWVTALEELRHARAAGAGDPRLVSLEVYALCMADRIDEALVLARQLMANRPEAADADAYWRFLAVTFGLPDPRSESAGTGTPR